MDTKQTLWASALTAIGASLCCVAPLVLVTMGIGGAWMSSLTKLEPMRPVFVTVTIALLVWAWHRLYRVPQKCEPGELCAVPQVRRRQRLIFWIVASALTLLLAFPWYAFLFY